MEIFIDFDGTITQEHGFTDPRPDAIDVINRLYDAGHIIVIYSCRANPQICPPEDVDKMKRYLSSHGIKYSRIEPNKPVFSLLIDDRAMNPLIHGGWSNLEQILKNDMGI